MKGGALALVGTSTIPAFLSRSVLAQATTAAANNKKLIARHTAKKAIMLVLAF